MYSPGLSYRTIMNYPSKTISNFIYLTSSLVILTTSLKMVLYTPYEAATQHKTTTLLNTGHKLHGSRPG